MNAVQYKYTVYELPYPLCNLSRMCGFYFWPMKPHKNYSQSTLNVPVRDPVVILETRQLSTLAETAEMSLFILS